uniref:Eukaryotic translation initiation factor 4 gamma, 3a n=1 Tax=Pygocentrus nattereri TaxID=42514 RepID=A0A3B4CU14_PYGNA
LPACSGLCRRIRNWAQMQTTRAALPSNAPSIRPGSQTPAAAVYPPNQTIMMTMTPMPFPSQTAQYYIPQYRHSAPYVGPPQQYSVPPPTSGTFYSGPGPGEYPTPYGQYRPYFPGQTVFPSSAPIIVPTVPQQPPPAKREKKPIRIRDPNQGGKDITEEIMSGSRNPTPPVGRNFSTPTPPQVRSTPAHLGESLMALLCVSVLEDKPRADSSLQKPSSPGLRPSESSTERREAPSLPLSDSSSPPLKEPELPTAPPSVPLPLNTYKPTAAGEPEEHLQTVSTVPAVLGQSSVSDTETSQLEASPSPSASPSPPLKAVNGLAESPAPSPCCDTEFSSQEILPASLPDPQFSTLSSVLMEEPQKETLDLREHIQEERPSSPFDHGTRNSSTSTTSLPSSITPAAVAPPPGLSTELHTSSCETDERSKTANTINVNLKAEADVQETDGCSDAIQSQTNSRKTMPTGTVPLFSSIRMKHRPPAECSVCLTALFFFLFVSVLVQSNGKKQYDRDFLLGFQFMPACVQKPEGLPQISDVVLDKINQTKVPLIRMVDPRLISRGPDFTPAFADFTRQLPGARGAALLSLTARRPPLRKIIMNVSVNDDVQLKKAENAWKPGLKREAVKEDPDAQKTQELLRKVRSILNKLTPQMFTPLMKQVTDLTINTEERLKGVIDLVFEKAIDEPSFSVAYANMCHCLATLKVPMADKPGTTVNFRKLLLNRCQKEFERDKMDNAEFEKKQKELDSAASERLQEELEEAKDKARRRSTGNIKFIGELFKLRMLTEPIMHDCVVKLLKNHDDESLECLCRLLTTIGKDLDFEKAKPRMDQYFNQMEKIVKERKTSSRIRFMLQDVIELRLHNWVSRRAEQGPKTIEQIHKEAKIEEQEEQRKVHQQLLSKEKRRAQINWVKGSSGGAKASDSGKDYQHVFWGFFPRLEHLIPFLTNYPVTVVPAKPVLSEEEMERKSKSIIDEFLHITDYKEAVHCVEELDQASLAVFVRVCVESTLERSQIAREHMGQLFYQLIQQGSLPRAQLYTGFADTLEMADDMAIDIPHIWLYLAELLCPLLKEGGIPMRELFTELSKPLLPVERAGVLLSEILHLLCKQMSHRKVGALWRESGLSWSDFLSEEQELQSFISEQKLQFTVSDCSSASSAASKPSLSSEELHKQLERLLLVDMASDEQIFDWVEANLDESQMSSSSFLRALMTAVCKAAVTDDNSSCKVDTAIIQKRLPVLHKYLNSDTERQLQALYALQALIVNLDQPPNLLRMFFDCLYDEDVISEDAFYKWEASKDPAEQEGKGIALKSVTAFFTWLREAEEESEDN